MRTDNFHFAMERQQKTQPRGLGSSQWARRDSNTLRFSKQNTMNGGPVHLKSRLAGNGPDLAGLIPGWDTLPEVTRAAMLALIRNATNPTN
jgi:hypothetical protein